ncbi:DNA-directed RNA polymerase subunit omega [Alienimonas californiensis]|uniref:DNA-directed RNA polymerase subunit omega n=1 Tax=Alienimonas californiensis TaxID=2527989 RepID=A0A517PEQ3_9PLAN|nr:DNA-directed RNA polymerase subunit omega [Alienimonas californiensis]QDT17846.1 DNA-directed RNA polymerase subunit omega [Alienimonas californiensis]
MLEAFKQEEIVDKVGGRFKLSTLIQKRMVALNRGARPLVEMQTKDTMAIVVQEILTDKIYLDSSQRVQVRQPAKSDGGPGVADLGPSLDDL